MLSESKRYREIVNPREKESVSIRVIIVRVLNCESEGVGVRRERIKE